MPPRSDLQCKLYPFGSQAELKFVVVCSFCNGKLLLSRHKLRSTWETQGGHIEAAETPLQAARRELFEESGVTDAILTPVCDYLGYTDEGSAYGAVFRADIQQLGSLPDSEMQEVSLFDSLPAELTYPNVTPLLFAEAQKLDPLAPSTLLNMAAAEGYSKAALIPTMDLIFDPSFRPFCEENLCGKYGINYSCPPDCGSPDEMKERIMAHPQALVLQSTWDIPDWRDETMVKAAKAAHNKAQLNILSAIRQQKASAVMAGASGCNLCPVCAIVDGEPCRYPDLKFSCLSAYCVYVKALAERCGMDYDYKEGKLSFYGLIAF